MGRLVLIRHGQSLWNAENRFTGWTDVDLSDRGVEEAKEAGDILSEIPFDVVHTSGLKRAQRTAEIIISRSSYPGEISVVKDELLNERHYGDLQGLNKAETAEKHAAEPSPWWGESEDECRENCPLLRGDHNERFGSREKCSHFGPRQLPEIYCHAYRVDKSGRHCLS